MKKLIFLLILLLVLFLIGSASSGKVAILPDILKLNSIAIDNNQVMRTEKRKGTRQGQEFHSCSLGKPFLKYILISCKILPLTTLDKSVVCCVKRKI
jgi:hypothetical protein